MTTPKRLLFIFLSIIAAGLMLFAMYIWMTLHYSYSDGDRAGFLQKISKKGWICKTWEGEMLLTSMPGAIPDKFEFTVRDEAIARQLEQAIGKRVVLTYAQHKGVPSSCFGDTQYFVEKVQISP